LLDSLLQEMKVILVSFLMISCVYAVRVSHYYEVYFNNIPNATQAWLDECEAKIYNKLDITDYKNWTFSIGHSLHFIDLEAVKNFFGISLPTDNLIPTNNPNVNGPDTFANGVLDSIPSHPVPESPSRGYQAFVRVLDDFFKWKPDYPYPNSNALNALNHQFHMLDVWAKVRNLADSMGEISADLCKCANEFSGYKLKEMEYQFFKVLRNVINETNLKEKGFPPITNNASWYIWRDHSLDPIVTMKPAGLFWKCQIQKYSPCCKEKRVGAYDYIRDGSGRCVNDCIYKRKDQPGGDLYYFGYGDQDSSCTSP